MAFLDQSSTRRGGNRPITTYPHPFFDPSQAYMPPTFKELIRWCLYLYTTHAEIAPAINKKVAYILTDLVYDTQTDQATQTWKKFFEETLRFRSMQFQLGVDFEVFGNAFASILYPFDRFLQCRQCDYFAHDRRVDWTYDAFRFYGTCPKCKKRGEMIPVERESKVRSRCRIARWFPQYIEIRFNAFTRRSQYIYRPPRWLRARLMDPVKNRIYVEDTPMVFMEAIRDGKNIEFDQDNIYHFKNESVSYPDEAFGMPPLLAAFKEAWLYQVYKRAQEAIALEHALPLTVISPAPIPGAVNAAPHMNYSLSNFSTKVDHMIRRWRRDQNAIFTMPFPFTVENIRGDAAALNIQPQMEQSRQMIIGALDLPQEFIYGGLNYCLDLDSYTFTNRGLEQLGEVVGRGDSHGNRPAPAGLSVVTHQGVGSVETLHRSKRKVADVQTTLGLATSPSHEHAYLVLREDLSQEWVKTAELRPHDRVAVRAGANLWPEQVPDLKYAVAEAKKAYDGLRDVSEAYPVTLPSRLTPELARLLGYLASEGCSDYRRFAFAQKDPEVMSDYLDCVQACFGYRPSVTVAPTECGSTEIGRRQAVAYLAALGAGGDAYTKVVPHCIRTAPKHLVAEFIKAYMEGDGCIEDTDEKQSAVAASVSDDLLKAVQLLLLNFGIVSSRYPWYGEHCPTLSIRSEYVDVYAREIGFVSSRKKTVLTARTPTLPTHIGEKLPYVKEALDDFRAKHFGGRSSWVFEPVDTALTEESYTAQAVADLLGRDVSMVLVHIRKGRLRAERLQDEPGRYVGYRISREALAEFLTQWGKGRRRTVPGRDAWGMTYSKLAGQDLAFIREKEPVLADRIEALLETRYVWDEVKSVDLHEEEVEMGDLTVREAHSFIADGLVCHNSGSSVSLRTVENVMLNRIGRNNEFIEWVRARAGRYFDLPPARIYHTDFKMADDPQQKQIALGLRTTNTVSDETTLKELGFNYTEELARRSKESTTRNAEMEQMIIAQARAQAEGMRIQMVEQAKAEVEAMAARQTAMQAAGIQQDPNAAAMNQMAGPRVTAAAGPVPAGSVTNPEVLRGSLSNAMKTMGPGQINQYIDTVSKTNPTIGMKYREMMGEMARDQQNVKVTQMQQEQADRQAGPRKTGS